MTPSQGSTRGPGREAEKYPMISKSNRDGAEGMTISGTTQQVLISE